MARAAPKSKSKTKARSKSSSKSSVKAKSSLKAKSSSKVTRKPAAAKASAKRAAKSVKSAAKKSAKSKSAAKRAPRQQPIDLYFWPTPNGYKISIMLEECGLPYNTIPVNISKGEQFEPDFLKISPNNRMPAIVDPNGPGGKPISVFESGAILQYLGRKTGKFYPANERARVAVDEWLFWQMGGLGPMAGQTHHFRNYAPEKIPYAINRYVNEVNRLYGVMNKRLADREFLADKYSIADMACVGWARGWEKQGQDIKDFPHLARWLDRVQARPAVKRGFAVTAEEHGKVNMLDPQVQAVLFGQRAR
jgi:GST-like protein